MLFNSFNFLIFFIVTTLMYFVLPQRLRVVMLLVASCIFYMFFIPKYILILFLTILVDYTAGIYIERTVGRKRKLWMVGSIVTTCLILFFFKYYNFFIDNVNLVFLALQGREKFDPLNIILPIGLSFHTFQSLSYVFEVYYGRQKAEKNFIIYSLYVMYYPQLVAGPIERPQNLLHQFHQSHIWDTNRVISGLQMIFWGLVKKMLIADRLAVFVNYAFDNSTELQGFQLLLAAYFFAFQIYCDFSGYSSIALGASRIMGIELMTNFRTPYLSVSIREFWSRWHISLSTWFRDYLYIPLGGNRKSTSRTIINQFVVFSVSGFWHGASWTFIVWGVLHAFYVVAEWLIYGVNKVAETSQNIIGRFVTLLKWALTFHLVVFAWIFFRADSIQSAVNYIKGIFNFNKSQIGLHMLPVKDYPYTSEFIFSLLAIVLLFTLEWLHTRVNLYKLLNSKPWLIQTVIYIALIGVFLTLAMFHSAQDFIYFQF